MNEQEQRIAIAEACGWVRDDVCDNWKKPTEGPYAVAFLNGSIHHRQLPEYLHDRNAMHAVLLTLNPEQQRQFMEILAKLVEADCYQIDAYHAWRTVTAPLAKLAEAFLRTIGKWKERS